MSDTALSAIATSTINRLGQVARQSTSAEKALVTGEKSLDDVSPSAAAHAQSAKNAIAFAKGTAIRSVEANAVTEVIINAITEGIQILTEAIGTAASEVNNLNTPETKVHTNTIFQSQITAFDELMSRIQWNGAYILTSATSELQFQLGEKENDLLKVITPDLTANALGLAGITVTTTDNAKNAESTIKDVLATLYDKLSQISGTKQDIEHITNRNTSNTHSLSEQRASIIDADIPEELAKAKQYEAHIDIIYARLTKILEILRRDVELFRAK